MVKTLHIYFLVIVLLSNSFALASGDSTGYNYIRYQEQSIVPSLSQYAEIGPNVFLPLDVNLSSTASTNGVTLYPDSELTSALNLPELRSLNNYLYEIESLILNINYRNVERANTSTDMMLIDFQGYDFLFDTRISKILNANQRYQDFINAIEAGDLHLSLAEIHGALFLFLMKEWIQTVSLLLHKDFSYPNQDPKKVLNSYGDRMDSFLKAALGSVPEYVKASVEALFNGSHGSGVSYFIESIGLSFKEIEAFKASYQNLREVSKAQSTKQMETYIGQNSHAKDTIETTLYVQRLKRVNPDKLSFMDYVWFLGAPFSIIAAFTFLIANGPGLDEGLGAFLSLIGSAIAFGTIFLGPSGSLSLREYLSPFQIIENRKNKKSLIKAALLEKLNKDMETHLMQYRSPVVLTQNTLDPLDVSMVKVKSQFSNSCRSFFNLSQKLLQKDL